MLAKAGKTFFKVLGLPITTVLGGLRKLFSLATGGHRRGGQQQQQREGPRAIGHRPVTYIDLEALTEEQRALVEETYQGMGASRVYGRLFWFASRRGHQRQCEVKR